MKQALYINCCIRGGASRTAKLGEAFLDALPEDWSPPDGAPLPQEQLERWERSASLHQAVDALPGEDRALFIRFYYLEQTVDEIAAATGQKPATLRVRLHRGRKRLKEFLQKRGVCCE